MSELGPISGLNKKQPSNGGNKLNITLDSNEAIITAFNLTKDDTTSLFNAIKKLCMESGLSELKKTNQFRRSHDRYWKRNSHPTKCPLQQPITTQPKNLNSKHLCGD